MLVSLKFYFSAQSRNTLLVLHIYNESILNDLGCDALSLFPVFYPAAVVFGCVDARTPAVSLYPCWQAVQTNVSNDANHNGRYSQKGRYTRDALKLVTIKGFSEHSHSVFPFEISGPFSTLFLGKCPFLYFPTDLFVFPVKSRLRESRIHSAS